MPDRMPRRRARLKYYLLGIAAALAAALVLLWGLVLVPYLQLRGAVSRCVEATDPFEVDTPAEKEEAGLILEAEVRFLGGTERAAGRLEAYLHRPKLRSEHRRTAMAMLEACGSQAVPALIRLLEHRNEGVRSGAAAALGGLGDGRAVAPLINALKDRRTHVRVCVARALGQLGASEPLVAALKDSEYSVVKAAAVALGRLGDQRAVPALIAALDGKQVVQNYEIRCALGAIGRPATPHLIEALKNPEDAVRQTAAFLLAQVGDERAVKPLVALLQDKSEVRRSARHALQSAGRAALPALLEAAAGDDWASRAVCEETASLLGELCLWYEEALPALEQAYVRGGWETRRRAVGMLKRVAPEVSAAVPLLGRCFRSGDGGIRSAASSTLMGLPRSLGARAVPEMIKGLADEDVDIRRDCARFLGRFGHLAGKAVPALAKAMGDEDRDVRRLAADSLGAIGPDAAAAVPALVKLLSHEDTWAVRYAVRALMRIGPAAKKAAAPALGDLLQHKSREMRAVAQAALHRLTYAPEEAVALLLKDLKSDNPEVRAATIPALGSMGPAAAKAISELVRLRRQGSDSALMALADIGEPAVPALAKALVDPNSKSRFRVAVALSRMGPAARGAAPQLIKALNDKEDGACLWATKALGNLGSATPPEVVAALADQVNGGSWPAAAALLRIGDPQLVVPELIRLLEAARTGGWQRSHFWARVTVVRTVGRFGPHAAEAVPVLIDALKADAGGYEFRAAAAWALGRIGPAEKVKPALQAALEDRYWLVRTRAREALEDLVAK